MIDRRTVFEIHRLKDVGNSERQIAQQFRIGRKSVMKYLVRPEQTVSGKKPQTSKLDAYREKIDSFLEESPDLKAPVVLQRLAKECHLFAHDSLLLRRPIPYRGDIFPLRLGGDIILSQQHELWFFLTQRL
jgi:transposase